MRPVLALVWWLWLATGLVAQPIIETVAGGYVPDGVPGLSAALWRPRAVAVDAAGNLYIASIHYSVVFCLSSSGELKIVAGNGIYGYSGDGGPATSASISSPYGVAVDAAGNLYIADVNNHRIRRVVLATGVIDTVAGSVRRGFSGDGGVATSASLYVPTGVAADAAGNLYIADSYNNRIRRVVLATGRIDTVAGNGLSGLRGDGGPAASASISYPQGVAVDAAGDLYIADTLNHSIRRVVVATGVIDTVAGSGRYGPGGDGGQATSARLYNPYAVSVDGAGNLYIADSYNHRIRRVVRATGLIDTVAGKGNQGFSGDGGAATSANLSDPQSVAVDAAGSLYIADYGNERIRRVVLATGVVDTVAGTGGEGFNGDGGAATSASLHSPNGVAADVDGNLYIADNVNHRIRRVLLATGVIETVAGNGSQGFSGDGGAATAANLTYPQAVTVDAAGNLYIADSRNHRIRRVVLATGVIDTVAGSSRQGFGGDGGAAKSASLSGPQGVAVDAAGNLYIADYGNERIRRVDLATGVIDTVAGNGTPGGGGDGGAATSASLYRPSGVAVDTAGNLYIADSFNQRIRRVVLATGVIDTVAGGGRGAMFSGDGGAATSANLYVPTGVAADAAGNLYIADSYNNRIRRVVLATGVIDTVARNGTEGGSGDGGVATSASLLRPQGVAVDAAGNLYIADPGNHRIRRVSSMARTGGDAIPSTRTFSGRPGGRRTSEQLTRPAWGVAY